MFPHPVPNICHPDASSHAIIPNSALLEDPFHRLKHAHFHYLHPLFLVPSWLLNTDPESKAGLMIALEHFLFSLMGHPLITKNATILPSLCPACPNSVDAICIIDLITLNHWSQAFEFLNLFDRQVARGEPPPPTLHSLTGIPYTQFSPCSPSARRSPGLAEEPPDGISGLHGTPPSLAMVSTKHVLQGLLPPSSPVTWWRDMTWVWGRCLDLFRQWSYW